MPRIPASTVRSSTIRLATVAVLSLAAAGCLQDMHNQPKFLPQRGSSFFPDGRSVRYQVAGTVARSEEDSSSYFVTGLSNGQEGEVLPVPLTPALLTRGQEQFNVYCSPCHPRVGDGEGMIVQRGYYQAASFHTDRLRSAPVGHFVNVILNGFGAMPMYGAEVAAIDRWAIAAYIRALQLSQNATTANAAPGSTFASLKQIAETQDIPQSLAEKQWGIVHPEAGPPALPAAVQNPERQAPREIAQNTPAASPDGATSRGGSKTESAAAGDADKGKALYATNCTMCHQATRAGMPPMVPSLVGVSSRLTAAQIREVINAGKTGGAMPMPAFGDKLSKSDVNNLIAYLKSDK